jgi:hypothetical protein
MRLCLLCRVYVFSTDTLLFQPWVAADKPVYLSHLINGYCALRIRLQTPRKTASHTESFPPTILQRKTKMFFKPGLKIREFMRQTKRSLLGI